MPNDCARCISLLKEEVMQLCQYYAYVEIIDARESSIFANTDNGTSLWQAYRGGRRMGEFPDRTRGPACGHLLRVPPPVRQARGSSRGCLTWRICSTGRTGHSTKYPQPMTPWRRSRSTICGSTSTQTRSR